MERAKNSSGFTLVELMVIVGLVAIFSAIALPSFISFVNNNRTQSAGSELYSLLQYARGTAAANRTTLTVCFDNGKVSVKSLCNKADSEALRLVDTSVDMASVSIKSSQTAVTFYPNGTTKAPATTIVLCGANGSANNAANGFTLTVDVSGSVRMWNRGKGRDNVANMSSCSP